MCTAATYKTKDFYFGRTLDYEFSYGDSITVAPRNYELNFRHQGKINSHYAIIGMAHIVDDYPLFYDAVNEKGVCMAGLNFVGNAVYSKPCSDRQNVAQFELISWILCQCKDMTEVRSLLENINITDEALAYIAQNSAGGMRDSITTLEKCLDYNMNLTMENVLKVTSGGVTENAMLQLTRFILNGYCKEALLHFNQIYMSGVDVSLFIKLYTEFLENCTKFLITLTPDITILSDETIQWLDEHRNALPLINNMLESILEIKTSYNSEDLKIIIESWIVRVCK